MKNYIKNKLYSFIMRNNEKEAFELGLLLLNPSCHLVNENSKKPGKYPIYEYMTEAEFGVDNIFFKVNEKTFAAARRIHVDNINHVATIGDFFIDEQCANLGMKRLFLRSVSDFLQSEFRVTKVAHSESGEDLN